MSECLTCKAPVRRSCDKWGIEAERDADGKRHLCQPLALVAQNCDQCGAPGPTVIVGQPFDYETATAMVCAGCLTKALAVLGGASS